MGVAAARVLPVDDHPAVRAGFRRLLESRPDLRVVAEAADARGALAAYLAHRPDHLWALGANNSDSVSRVKYVLDGNGFVKHTGDRFMIMKNMVA